MYQEFFSALQSTNLVELTFNSKEKGELTRKAAPMDFGPWARSSSDEVRYHFIDLDSDSRAHPLSITPDQVICINELEEKFSPEKLVHWQPNWHCTRDWGDYS